MRVRLAFSGKKAAYLCQPVALVLVGHVHKGVVQCHSHGVWLAFELEERLSTSGDWQRQWCERLASRRDKGLWHLVRRAL